MCLPPILIPIKTKSIRCPNKNKILLPYTLDYIEHNYIFPDVRIITDSNIYDNILDKYDIIQDRWIEEDIDLKNTTELSSINKYLSSVRGKDITNFLLLLVTQPLRDKNLINKVIKKKDVTKEHFDLITSYVKVPERNIFKINKDTKIFNIKNIQRKGCLCEEEYIADGAIYYTSKEFVNKCINSNDSNLTFWNNKTLFVNNEAPLADIDTEYDLKLFRTYFKNISLVWKQ